MREGDQPALRERVRHHAGDDEDEQRKKLEIPGEDRPASCLVLVLRRQHALHDELIGAPVPDAEDGRTEQDPGPWEVWVARRLPHVEEARARGTDHLTPPTERVETNPRDRDCPAN